MSFNVDIQKAWNGEKVKILGRKAIGKSVFEIGLIVEGYAKQLCPVDTGRLRASITTQTKEQSTKPTGKGAVATDLITKPNLDGMAYVGTPVFYGPYQECGTVRSEAQAFLRPALDMARGKALTVVEHNGRLQFAEYLR
jgi:hypothetical protein